MWQLGDESATGVYAFMMMHYNILVTLREFQIVRTVKIAWQYPELVKWSVHIQTYGYCFLFCNHKLWFQTFTKSSSHWGSLCGLRSEIWTLVIQKEKHNLPKHVTVYTGNCQGIFMLSKIQLLFKKTCNGDLMFPQIPLRFFSTRNNILPTLKFTMNQWSNISWRFFISFVDS